MANKRPIWQGLAEIGEVAAIIEERAIVLELFKLWERVRRLPWTRNIQSTPGHRVRSLLFRICTSGGVHDARQYAKTVIGMQDVNDSGESGRI